MESSNPVFNEKAIKRAKALDKTDDMTIGGTVGKTTLLLALLLFAAGASWNLTDTNPDLAGVITLVAGISGFVLALVIIFTKPNPILVSLYSLAQGFLLGSISFLFAAQWQNIVAQAIVLTLSIFISMLALYGFRIIKVTERLRSGIIVATFGVLIFYLMSFIIGLFSDTYTAAISNGTTGIIIAVVIVIIAALNLLLDFDFIEKGANKGLPKSFEWYGAFGLMVTLIWLYISILQMLAIARD